MIIMVCGCVRLCVRVYMFVYISDVLFVYSFVCVCCVSMLYYTAPLGAILWNYRLSVYLPPFQ